MHNVKTWVKGSDKKLDKLFDSLREKQYNNTLDKLHKNYSIENFTNCLAYSICFEFDKPIMCASISHKSCWPKNTYRILNRLWKPDDVRIKFPRQMSPSFGLIALDQINWIKSNLDYDCIFISRQTKNWQNFVISEFQRQYNFSWNTNNNKYLTCENETNDDCWQNIIYVGNDKVLKKWKHRT